MMIPGLSFLKWSVVRSTAAVSIDVADDGASAPYIDTVPIPYVGEGQLPLLAPYTVRYDGLLLHRFHIGPLT